MTVHLTRAPIPLDVNSCRSLWAEVLWSALFEVLRGRPMVWDKDARPVGVEWLRSEDFVEVCTLAGFDPLPFRDAVEAAMACPDRRDAMAARLRRAPERKAEAA